MSCRHYPQKGGGNCYAILYDNDDGRLRVGRIDDAVAVDLQPSRRYETSSGWRTLQIEARTNQIKFFMNGQLLVQTTDTNFAAGHVGFGYRSYPGSPAQYPAARGVYFDNFVADTLDFVPLPFSGINLLQDGRLRFPLNGTVGTTNSTLNPTNWLAFTNVINGTNVNELYDEETQLPCRFYQARQSP